MGSIKNTKSLLIVLFLWASVFPSTALALVGPQGVIGSIEIDKYAPANVYCVGKEGNQYYIYHSPDYGLNWSRSPIDSRYSLVLGRFDPVSLPGVDWVAYAISDTYELLRSTDGKNWQTVNGLTGQVRSIAVHPNGTTVYAARVTPFPYQPDIFISYNQGLDWQLFATNLGTRMVIDPVNPLVMYVSEGWVGVYRSVDGGITWTLGNNGLPMAAFGGLQIHPVNTSILFLATNNSIYQSVDAGSTWVEFPLPGQPRSIYIDPNNPDRMFLFSSGSNTRKSEDGGQTWNTLFESFRSLAVSPDGSGIMYAGTDNRGMYKSSDNGDTWQQLSEIPPAFPESSTSASSFDYLILLILLLLVLIRETRNIDRMDSFN